MKTSFWTPKAAYYSIYIPWAACLCFSGSIDEHFKDSVDSSICEEALNNVKKSTAYIAAGVALLAIGAVVVLNFLLSCIVTVLHDLIVGLGALTGCCEIEDNKLSFTFQ
jgi:hypothetical protein